MHRSQCAMAEADLVHYGRRRGSIRGTRAGKTGKAARLEEGTQGKVAVVGAEEWQRIKASLDSKQRELEKQRDSLERKQQEKEKSQNIVKHWENTIEGQRLKKLQARKQREEREEEERQKVDQAEAEYQAECRRKAIERAKTLLYYQTDRVKNFHGALLLTEVLRERDAQCEYKKRKKEVANSIDQQYLQAQEEAPQERERRIHADQLATVVRAKALDETAKFQIMQISERKKQAVKEREEALQEQAKIEKEVSEYMQREAEVKTQQKQKQELLRCQLDQVLEENEAEQKRRSDHSLAEDRNVELFQQAKRRMTRLRKDKEAELFRQFQTQQQQMCELLMQQRQKERSDEDECIAKAVANQESKREQEQQEKLDKFKQQTLEIQSHRREMVVENKRRQRQQQEADQEVLCQKKAQDLIFHQQQQVKAKHNFHQALELQQTHLSQTHAQLAQSRQEREEEKASVDRNRQFMEVEEQQFQEYAKAVVSDAATRGANVQPLLRAAQAGPGGGKGPACTGNGALRPSFQTMDAAGVELPSYMPRQPHTPKNTQKRMGFTW